MTGNAFPPSHPARESIRDVQQSYTADARSERGGPLELPPERALVNGFGARFLMWINALAFSAILIVGGVMFWITPKQAISATEKRELAQAPELTFAAVFDGSYEKKFEEYYNDNFPWRERWIDLTATLKSWRGFRGEEQIEVFNEVPGTEEEAEANEPGFEAVEADFSRVRQVVVVGDRAVQQFGGSASTLAPFLDMIRQYRSTLPGIRIYVMSIPIGADMFLPRQVNNGQMKEKQNIDQLYSMLPSGVEAVRAYDAILPHRDEYIQFRTDHHWTGRGAYYAYRAFAQAAGFTPLNLDQMTYGRTQGEFLGTLYNRTRSPALQANPDYVEYWKVPGETRATIYSRSLDSGSPGRLYQETASGGNSYGVFIGGDHALMRVETQNRSGRSILVVKDSYGNAFVPYLAAHYDRVFIVDFRHFKGNIPQFMAQNGIGELLYAFNTFNMNSRAAAAKGVSLLRDGRR